MTVTITACGLNIAYHMTQLTDNNIVLYDVVRIDNRHVQIVCSSRYSHSVVEYLTNNNFGDIIVTRMGLYRIFTGMRQYWLLTALMLLIVPILLVNSMYCANIVVDGDVDSSVIIDSLDSIGVRVGSRLSSIDYDSIEDYLSSTHDFSYTVVDIVGNTLYVSVIDNVRVPTIDYTQARDIVATHSGIVTSISVVQGTSAVSVGQYVSQGDVLIYGLRTYTDGSTTPVYAIGTVTAQVQVSSTVQYTGYCQQWQYTDNTTTIVGIDICSLQVYSRQCPYEYYDMTSSTVTIYPLAIDVTYYYLTEKLSTSVAVSYDNYLATMQDIALAEAMSTVYFAVDSTIYSGIYNTSVTVTLQGSVVISNDTITSSTEDI